MNGNLLPPLKTEKNMNQYWLVVGSPKNWQVAFENGNLWGLKEFREMKSLWNLLEEGDKLLFYVSGKINGIVGIGKVVTKIRQTNPLWPDEIQQGSVLWPLRFEFEVEYCLNPTAWKTNCYRNVDIQLIARMVFQCAPISVVDDVRRFFDLSQENQTMPLMTTSATPEQDIKIDHESAKKQIAEIGRIQGFLADMEFPIEGNRLDVVWRRVERSVPTYVFEVQVGGDIYHALAKLKHAYDLWNSHIFLAAEIKDRHKCEELILGPFNEIKHRVKFLRLNEIAELYKRKISYQSYEKGIGIML